MYETPCSCGRICSIMYMVFRSEDMGRYICRQIAKSTQKGGFGAPDL